MGAHLGHTARVRTAPLDRSADAAAVGATRRERPEVGECPWLVTTDFLRSPAITSEAMTDTPPSTRLNEDQFDWSASMPSSSTRRPPRNFSAWSTARAIHGQRVLIVAVQKVPMRLITALGWAVTACELGRRGSLGGVFKRS